MDFVKDRNRKCCNYRNFSFPVIKTLTGSRTQTDKGVLTQVHYTITSLQLRNRA